MIEQNTLIPDHFNTPGLSASLSDKKLRAQVLKARVESLNNLAENLDPYSKLSPETQNELKALGILVLDDPFAITNQLVVILEDSVEELHKLESELGA
tara:strand:- start:109 stop:402 length:294 start_codon:yes stop_codon:yes gene_type:complete